MKKHRFNFTLACLSLLLLSCSNPSSETKTTAPPQPAPATTDSIPTMEIPAPKLDSIVASVISLSANDFYKNQKPAPVDFKDVKLKYIKKTNGEELYILCGQFITSDQQATDFATVKNSDYEQWIGTSASTYCQNSAIIKYTKEDLAIALKNKFNALNK